MAAASGRRGASGLGHLPHAARAVEAAGEDRRAERFEVRLTRQLGVERFEPLRPRRAATAERRSRV